MSAASGSRRRRCGFADATAIGGVRRRLAATLRAAARRLPARAAAIRARCASAARGARHAPARSPPARCGPRRGIGRQLGALASAMASMRRSSRSSSLRELRRPRRRVGGVDLGAGEADGDQQHAQVVAQALHGGSVGAAGAPRCAPIAVSSTSVSALRLRRAYSARNARPRALADSAAQSAEIIVLARARPAA